MNNSTNNVAKGTTIKGDIETFGNFRLDGNLIGNIQSKSRVVVGKEAKLEGNLYAQSAEIEGEIEGVLEITESLVLRSTAVINGDIITNKLTIDPGAQFNGKCRMGESVTKNDHKPVKQVEKGGAKPTSAAV
ncbi:polymer-forming cytoskeletal protein [Algivirga pacifica]